MITPKRQLGNKGEEIACDFLIKNGFRIIGRNIGNKLGEIDIIARKGKVLHFIEVKSGNASDKLNPSENLNYHKIRKFLRAVEIYISANKISEQQRWQMDAIVVVFKGNPRAWRAEPRLGKGLAGLRFVRQSQSSWTKREQSSYDGNSSPLITHLQNINIQ